MADKAKRISALIIALLFLVSSFGFTGLVIWRLAHGDDGSNNQTAQQTLTGQPLENYQPVKSVKKLQTIDLENGSGKTVKTGDKIVVHYTGALAKTGIIFQSSKDLGQPVPLEVKKGAVIDGWVKGVVGMKEGGKRRLLIPSSEAYGKKSLQGIPANSDLVFDIELIAIQ